MTGLTIILSALATAAITFLGVAVASRWLNATHAELMGRDEPYP